MYHPLHLVKKSQSVEMTNFKNTKNRPDELYCSWNILSIDIKFPKQRNFSENYIQVGVFERYPFPKMKTAFDRKSNR